MFLDGQEELPGDRTHSEQTAREIDEEIRRILAEALDSVRHVSWRRGVRRWWPWPSG